MNPTRTSYCNDTLLAPKGHPDCGDLPIFRDEISVWSFWMPEPPELAALNRGGTVALRIQGTTHPPLSIMATNPDGPENRSPIPTGIQLIAIERDRQIHDLGINHEHDDQHIEGELSAAAATYALHAAGFADANSIQGDNTVFHNVVEIWPFDESEWSGRTEKIPALIKAGALIAAEIDRLQRLNPPA